MADSTTASTPENGVTAPVARLTEVTASITIPVVNRAGAEVGTVTLDPADNWRFRTPSLRNVALTAPYLHDGSVPTLAAIIERYNAGSVATPQGDPKLKALGLSPAERGALEAFLRSLSSPAVALLVRDAFAAPIGDRGPAP